MRFNTSRRIPQKNRNGEPLESSVSHPGDLVITSDGKRYRVGGLKDPDAHRTTPINFEEVDTGKFSFYPHERVS